MYVCIYVCNRFARGVMVIVVGNGHSNTVRSCLHFIESFYAWESYKSLYYPFIYGQIVGQTVLFNLGKAARLGKEKLWIQRS